MTMWLLSGGGSSPSAQTLPFFLHFPPPACLSPPFFSPLHSFLSSKTLFYFTSFYSAPPLLSPHSLLHPLLNHFLFMLHLLFLSTLNSSLALCLAVSLQYAWTDSAVRGNFRVGWTTVLVYWKLLKEFKFPRVDLQYELVPRYVLHSGVTQTDIHFIFLFYFTALSALFCMRILTGGTFTVIGKKMSKPRRIFLSFTVYPLICC